MNGLYSRLLWFARVGAFADYVQFACFDGGSPSVNLYGCFLLVFSCCSFFRTSYMAGFLPGAYPVLVIFDCPYGGFLLVCLDGSVL